MKYKIRVGDISDALDLAQFAERSFRETFGKFNTSENMESFIEKTYSLQIQQKELADLRNRILIVENEQQEIIGFSHLNLKELAFKKIEILRFYIDSKFHGKGLAQELMNEILTWVQTQNAEKIWLGVWEKNLGAQKFYQKFDFILVGSHEFKLGSDLQTDLIFEKKL